MQSGDDVAAAVTEQRRAQISSEWRTAIATDTAVQVKHLLAPEMAQQSLIVDAGAAATEVTRRFNLYKVRRDYWQLRVQLDSSSAIIGLGDVIEMALDRFGYESGRLLAVLGNELDPKANRSTLKVWG